MMNSKPNYLVLSEFYEQCYEKYGAVPQGVDWPNHHDLSKRFNIMLDVFAHEAMNSTINLLDLGCGYGELVNYLATIHLNKKILYTGMDISKKFVEAARQQHPDHDFLEYDILKNPLPPESYDYVIMNGLLTEKRNLFWHEMVSFAQQMIQEAFKLCRKGIAFNVMSYHVDWCQPHLFYWSFDEMASFVFKHCTRHMVLRNDYGLYEYTVYAYKKPRY